MKILRGLNNLWFAFCAPLGICVLGQLITTLYISWAFQDDRMLHFCIGEWRRGGWLLGGGGLFLFSYDNRRDGKMLERTRTDF